MCTLLAGVVNERASRTLPKRRFESIQGKGEKKIFVFVLSQQKGSEWGEIYFFVL